MNQFQLRGLELSVISHDDAKSTAHATLRSRERRAFLPAPLRVFRGHGARVVQRNLASQTDVRTCLGPSGELVITIFTLSNAFVMPFWLLMILAPGWSLTARLMRSPWSVIPLALAYTAMVVPKVSTLLPLLAPPTLAGVVGLLATPAGATVVWLHVLAFDLFVGRWIYLDSRERGVPAWWMSPVLLLTLAFGPFGFLVYMAVRALRPRPDHVDLQ